MAWEWVAPVATAASGAIGVVFTWLAGAQSRTHAERMVRESREAERQVRLTQERRDAYFAALRVVDLETRRVKYKNQGNEDKLRQVEEYWPKSKRIEMIADALNALHAFGSDEARRHAVAWGAALEEGDHQKMGDVIEQFRAQMSSELRNG
ncbi:hypothetical protein [Streptomyces sp. AC495_CC817]|uniref:hypothetical protein n=1 Tax=Streptomyces sp. AC495_CC817 TaxID=2823900 RepID=UPI001C266FAD|nr:hypothetical protein [Streptomyces sp. AC495_CC817]